MQADVQVYGDVQMAHAGVRQVHADLRMQEAEDRPRLDAGAHEDQPLVQFVRQRKMTG